MCICNVRPRIAALCKTIGGCPQNITGLCYSMQDGERYSARGTLPLTVRVTVIPHVNRDTGIMGGRELTGGLGGGRSEELTEV